MKIAKEILKLSIIIFVLITLVTISFGAIQTIGSSNGISNATLTGNIDNLGLYQPVEVWFEYGGKTGCYLQHSDHLSVNATGNFVINISGFPLILEQTYYFRAGGNVSGEITRGSEMSFTLDTPTPMPIKNFGKHFEELKESRFNLNRLTTVLPKTWTDIILETRIFYGIFFGMIFLALWIRQEDIGIPALLGMLIGGTLWYWLPPEWMNLVQSLFIVSFAALIYATIKGRK